MKNILFVLFMVTSLNLLCAAQADMEENSSYRQVKPKVEHSIDCRCKSFNDSSLSGGNVRYISLRKHGPWRSASDLTQLSQFFNDNRTSADNLTNSI